VLGTEISVFPQQTARNIRKYGSNQQRELRNSPISTPLK